MKTRSAVFSACTALVALTLSFSARAEEDAEADTHPLGFNARADGIYGTVSGNAIAKADLYAGMSYDVSSRFTVRIDLGAGTLRLGYNGSMDDSLMVESKLWSYVGTSGAVGASYLLYDGEVVRVGVRGGWETSLLHMKPEITSLIVRTPQGGFNITPYGKQNVDASMYWSRFTFGMQTRFLLGRMEPNLGLAFERVDATMELHLNDDSRRALARLGYDASHVETRHMLTFWYVPVTGGLDFRVAERTSLGAAGSIAPALDSWLYGATLNFRHAF